MKGSFKTALIAAVVSAFVAAGAAVATTQTFVLGTSNTVDAASTVTAGATGLNAKMLQLTNNSTGSSATALGLTTPSSRPPLIVSSQAKVANLNADKLDGIDSGGFVPSAAVRRFGPVVTARTPNSGNEVYPIVSVGQFSFKAFCYASQSGLGSQVTLLVSPSAAHSSLAGLTDAAGGSAWNYPDMSASGLYTIADVNVFGTTTPTFTPATGDLLAPNGQEISYNVYMGQNLNGATGCVFGGSFVVK